ncbi:TPA: tail fiber protein [Pasteurella multocida]|nr:tail fiber protein [Pasteurella multocida]
MPLGSIVAFPKNITPQGFLRADGTTFNQATYPDLYTVNGNSNRLPNLTRSDVGMTAYFATDSIPDGWIAFDSIRTIVTQQSYPELYQYLVAKYGSIAQVPLAEDRFIRNAGNGLNVGATQNDEIKKHTHRTPLSHNSNDYQQMSQYYNDVSPVLTAPFVMTLDGSDGTNNVYARQKNNLAAEGGEETRPKSIVLKLCIKAKNKFDDIQFWIKAFGVIENAGVLDVGNLAQDLQQIGTKTQQLEKLLNQNREQTSFKLQEVEEKINSTKKESTIVWSGNVTQSSTNVIQLKDSVLNKRLTLYLQSSSSHSLNNNDNVHITSVYVDKYSLEVAGKKYIHGAMYAGGWRNVQLELVEENKIKIIDISSFFLKQITAI